MARVVVSLTMSLDGFIAGPNDDFDHPLAPPDGMKLLDRYTSGTGPGKDGDARFNPTGGTHLRCQAQPRGDAR